MSGKEITALMRLHRVTIRQLAERMQITQKRIRFVRYHGIPCQGCARDWIEGITGEDPGFLGGHGCTTRWGKHGRPIQ